MSFEWYTELYRSDDLMQGDILNGCNIPIPNNSVFNAIIRDQEDVEEPLEIKTANLIILSQACDISNNKIESIVLCPVWELDKLIKKHEYFKGSKARENLRQGKEPSYHLLNSYNSDNIEMDYSVVDFHQIFTLPKIYLQLTARNIEYRIRLNPPYREHLSQAFARYFMRVGLPSDISKTNIKKYTNQT